jgi:hypothetical protein
MCIGRLFGGGGSRRVYIPPPPPPDPSLEARLQSDRDKGLQQQQEATRARKKQLQAGFGRRSLLSSGSGGYLSNTTQNTRLG